MLKRALSPCFEIKTLKNPGAFCGYASVFHIEDAQGDQVMPGAFKSTLNLWQTRKAMPLCLWQHDQKKPIGHWIALKEDQKGLFVEGQLLLALTQAKEAYSLMRAGVVKGLSIGFFPLITRSTQPRKRKIFQIDLIEISVVTHAANPYAHLHNLKGRKSQ